MERIKLTDNFWLDEYIPKQLYEQFWKRPHILFGLLDRRLVMSDQMLRDHFGPIIINNWWYGKDRNWSGLRIPASPYYSDTSQHTYGRASDKIFIHQSVYEVWEYIEKEYERLGITFIEKELSKTHPDYKEVNWVHSDTRWSKSPELLIYYLKKKKDA